MHRLSGSLIVHDHARWKRINTLEPSDITTLQSLSKLPNPPELSAYSSLIYYSRSWIHSSPLLPYPLHPSLVKRRKSKYQLIKSTRVIMVATASSRDGHPLRMFRLPSLPLTTHSCFLRDSCQPTDAHFFSSRNRVIITVSAPPPLSFIYRRLWSCNQFSFKNLLQLTDCIIHGFSSRG